MITKSGRLTWCDTESEQHTQSPDLAQAWRDAGRGVEAITNPDEIARLIRDETVNWAAA